jgi:hypothetical protein
MNGSDLTALYQRFLSLCVAYVANPDILTALALDQVTGQFPQACASQLDAPALQRCCIGCCASSRATRWANSSGGWGRSAHPPRNMICLEGGYGTVYTQ